MQKEHSRKREVFKRWLLFQKCVWMAGCFVSYKRLQSSVKEACKAQQYLFCLAHVVTVIIVIQGI